MPYFFLLEDNSLKGKRVPVQFQAIFLREINMLLRICSVLAHWRVFVPGATTSVIWTRGMTAPRGCGCARSQNRAHSLCRRTSPSATRACRRGPGSAAPHWAQTSTAGLGGGRMRCRRLGRAAGTRVWGRDRMGLRWGVLRS